MSQPPSTPVKIPAAAAAYTDATVDPQLRSDLNSLLLKEGHIHKIQDSLLHALNAHSTNWPSIVQTHALTLLRSGEATTFPTLIRRVLDDVRSDTQNSSSGSRPAQETNGVNGKKGAAAAVNGASTNGSTPGADEGKGASSSSAGAAVAAGSLAIPPAVLEEVLKVTRESLEVLCTEIESEES